MSFEEGAEGGKVGGREERFGIGGKEARGEEGRGKGFWAQREGVGGIGAEEGTQGGEEEFLSAFAGSGEQEAGTFVGEAGEGVAEGALEEGLEVRGMVGEAGEKIVPDLGEGLWIVGHRDEAGDVVIGLMREKGASTEIEGAVEDGEQIGVGVEVGGVFEDAGEGAGEVEELGEMGCGEAALGMFEDAFAEGALFGGEGANIVVEGVEGGGSEGDDFAGGIELPAGAVEEEPAPLGDEANLGTELLDEALGVAVVGEGGGVTVEEILDAMFDGGGG